MYKFSEKNRESVEHLSAQIYRHCQIFMLNKLKEFGIGIGQLHFLKNLFIKDGVSQEYLAKKLNFTKATSARAIKKLEEMKYIIRKKDPKDARIYLVFLTRKGKKLEPKISKIILEWREILLKDFSKKEEDLFAFFLKKSINNIIENKNFSDFN